MNGLLMIWICYACNGPFCKKNKSESIWNKRKEIKKKLRLAIRVYIGALLCNHCCQCPVACSVAVTAWTGQLSFSKYRAAARTCSHTVTRQHLDTNLDRQTVITTISERSNSFISTRRRFVWRTRPDSQVVARECEKWLELIEMSHLVVFATKNL